MPAAQGKQHLYKLFGAIAVFVVLGVVGLLAAPALIDWNAYRDALEDTLSQATGLAVDIEGDLDIAFLPSPRVNASDVTWAGADGQQPSVQIPEVRAAVALTDLIGGDLRVTDVTLAGPRAVLVLDESGRPMLAGLGTDGGGAGEADPAEPPAFHLDRVEIRDGTLSVVRQGRPDSIIFVDGLSGVVTTSGTTGRVSAKGAGLVDGVSLNYSASVGRIRPDQPVPLRWTLGLPESGLSVSFQGGVEGAMPDADAVGRMEIEADRLGVLSEAVGLPLAALAGGSAKLAAEVRLSAARLALDGVELTADGASATGALELAFGNRPRADIEIDFSRIDMDRFAEGERIDVAAGLALFLEGLADARPAALLDDVALQLRATADAMKVGGNVVHDAALSVDLENGTLFIEQAEVLLPGGSDFSLNGVLEPRQESLSFEGGLAITSDNLRALMDWLGVDAGRVPPARLRALELSGTLRSGPESLSLDGLSAQIDATRASGRLALGLGPKPRFDIDLAVDTFSLDAYRLRDRQPSEPRPLAGGRPDPVGFLASADGHIRLQFDRLTVLGQPLERVELAGTVSTGSIDLHSVEVADYAGISLDGSVVMSTAGGRPQIGLQVTSRTRDPERLLRHLGLYPTAASRRLTGSTLDVHGEGDFELVTFSAEAALAGGSLVIDGGVADPFGASQLTAEIQANHPTPVQLVRALGLPGITAADTQGLSDDGMLQMAAKARAAEDRISIDIVSLSIGEAEIAGQANLSLAAARPELDLVIVGGDISGVGVLAALSSVQRATDVNLDLKAERLTLGPVWIDNASARAEMTAVGASIGPVRGETLGGSVDLALSVGAESGHDVIEGEVAARGLDPGDLLQALGGPTALSGALDLRSAFSARGRTVTEYLASLSGRAEIGGTITVKPAEGGNARYAAGLLGDNLPPISQVTELSAVLEGAFGKQPAPISAVFSVSRGIARIESALVTGTGARAVGYGTWDIPGQRLESSVDVIRSGADDAPYFTLGLAGPPRTPNVRIAGTWLKPR